MDKKQRTGYHGTKKEAAGKIIEQNEFLDSSTDSEWLGQGVYFFEYLEHAIQWTKRERFQGFETAVLAVDLCYHSQQLLDLDDPVDYRKMETVVVRYVDRAKSNREALAPVADMSQKQRWCFACNLIRKLNEQIGIIVYTFPLDKTNNYQKRFFQSNQREICVSNHSLIHNIRLERRDP